MNENSTNCTDSFTNAPAYFVCDCIDSGDTAFMLMATTFVFLQTPFAGLAQAGAIRRKNALSMIMQTLTAVVIGSLLWVMFGFSLTFGPSQSGCHVSAPSIPVSLFAAFQMMFALMTPFIVTGSWAEKMNFRPFLIFITLWPILVYYPLAHWIWNIEGWLTKLGPTHNYTVRDFAGGIVIHTSTGVAGLIVSLFMERNSAAPTLGHHNLPLNIIGGVVVWGGWYSFNGGSAFAANAQAAQALLNTHIAACTSAASWVVLSRIKDKDKWHLTEIMNGGLAGLAGITAGSGFVTSWGAFVIGIIVGILSWLSVRLIKDYLKINDVLDVTSLQGVPGIVGTTLIGFLLYPPVFNGPTGPPSIGVVYGGNGFLIGTQLAGVCVGIFWSASCTTLIMLFLRLLEKVKKIPLQLTVSPYEEEIGLDMSQIGEQAYDDKLDIELDLGKDVTIGLLNQACAAGNIELVKRYVLKDRINPKDVDYDGRSPLHLAVYNNRLEVVKFLIDANVDINATDLYGMNPLDDAFDMHKKDASILISSEVMIKYLVSHGAKPTTLAFYDFLKHCTDAKYYTLIRLYILAGININGGDYDQRTGLMIAHSYRCNEIVELLMDSGANVDLKDRWGNTCFSEFTRWNNNSVPTSINLTRRLSIRGLPIGGIADLPDEEQPKREDSVFSLPKKQKKKPKSHELCMAAQAGNIQELRRLLHKGEDPSKGDYDDRTPLHMAASGGYLDIVKVLCKHPSVNINHLDRWRHTPLQGAIQNGHSALADYLRQHGGVVVNTNDGVNLCYHASLGALATIKDMKKHGKDINMVDYAGRSCLHVAVCYGHKDLVAWLLHLPDCNPHPIDRFNNTPLDDAEREGQEEIANYISERMRFFLPRELMNTTSSDPNSDFSAMQVCSSAGEAKKSSETSQPKKKKEKDKKSKKKNFQVKKRTLDDSLRYNEI